MRGARDLHRAPSREDLYSSQRSIDSVASRSLLTGNGTGMSGVGIFFQQEGDGKVYVRTIVSGGSAERDGELDGCSLYRSRFLIVYMPSYYLHGHFCS